MGNWKVGGGAVKSTCCSRGEGRQRGWHRGGRAEGLAPGRMGGPSGEWSWAGMVHQGGKEGRAQPPPHLTCSGTRHRPSHCWPPEPPSWRMRSRNTKRQGVLCLLLGATRPGLWAWSLVALSATAGSPRGAAELAAAHPNPQAPHVPCGLAVPSASSLLLPPSTRSQFTPSLLPEVSPASEGRRQATRNQKSGGRE